MEGDTMRPIRWLGGCCLVALAGCQESPGSAIAITTDELPAARVAMDYEAALSCVDEAEDPTWEVVSGDLPPGVELSVGGHLSGAPTRSGTYLFEVAADDGLGDDVVELSIEIPPVTLISGFEPFGGYPTNPSWDSLLPLDEELLAGMDLRILELPVEWDVSWALLLDEIERLSPRIALGTGMADSDAMRFEIRAQNLENSTDNAGVTRWYEPVVEGAPEELSTDLPVEEMAAAMEGGGYPTTISSNAGTYLCNSIFYHLTHYQQLEADDPPLTGFIHVPPASYSGTFEVEDVTAAHELGLAALAAWLDGDRRAAASTSASCTAPTYLDSLPAPAR
jgi:pyroglutamyl-peptidase